VTGPKLDLRHMPPPPIRRDWRIGAIGAGFIMRDVQLVAYRKLGLHVAAIASRRVDQAREVATARAIARVYDSYQELIADLSIEVLDIAVPPDVQPQVIAEAIRHPHIRGILAQKPLAMNYRDALAAVESCEKAGILLAVNQNMRYDQSIRALKTLIDRGDLGQPVLATIEMRAIPHWQSWLRDYPGLTLAAMSIHHLDCFRYLFGDPEFVYASARTDPRTAFPHRDGIVLYILEYPGGLRASAWDDVWAGPAREGAAPDTYIKWRVEGTDGLAQGTSGGPGYPNAVPSTVRFATRSQPGVWLAPQWPEVWFPDAFQGTMGELLDSLTQGRTPEISGRGNLGTMALVDACYRSLDRHRPVRIQEIVEEGQS
jgi:predicted dehydrogenase